MAYKNEKAFSRQKLKKILEKLKNKKIVFTNGCFDLLHIGHIRVLRKAKELGDVLIVALNTDRSVRQIKGRERPIIPLKERSEIISSLEMVDYVTWFSEATPKTLVKLLKPNIIVKGGDYKPEEIIGADLIRDEGGKVFVVPLVRNRSTTAIVKKIANL